MLLDEPEVETTHEEQQDTQQQSRTFAGTVLEGILTTVQQSFSVKKKRTS